MWNVLYEMANLNFIFSFLFEYFIRSFALCIFNMLQKISSMVFQTSRMCVRLSLCYNFCIQITNYTPNQLNGQLRNYFLMTCTNLGVLKLITALNVINVLLPLNFFYQYHHIVRIIYDIYFNAIHLLKHFIIFKDKVAVENNFYKLKSFTPYLAIQE